MAKKDPREHGDHVQPRSTSLYLCESEFSAPRTGIEPSGFIQPDRTLYASISTT